MQDAAIDWLVVFWLFFKTLQDFTSSFETKEKSMGFEFYRISSLAPTGACNFECVIIPGDLNRTGSDLEEGVCKIRGVGSCSRIIIDGCTSEVCTLIDRSRSISVPAGSPKLFAPSECQSNAASHVNTSFRRVIPAFAGMRQFHSIELE